jgi:hypothetical protein
MLDFSSSLTFAKSEPFIVYIWPDGDFCEESAYEEYLHKSDDFTRLDLNDYDDCQNFFDQDLLREIIEEFYGQNPYGD